MKKSHAERVFASFKQSLICHLKPLVKSSYMPSGANFCINLGFLSKTLALKEQWEVTIYRRLYCNSTLDKGWPMSRGNDFQGAAHDLKACVANCVMTAEWPLEKVAKALRGLLPADVAAMSATVQVVASQVNPIRYKRKVAWPLGPFSSKRGLDRESRRVEHAALLALRYLFRRGRRSS